MMIVIAMGIIVLIMAVYFATSFISPSVDGIDSLRAISLCDDLCLSDNARGVVNLFGTCAYNEAYSFANREIAVSGEGMLFCSEITNCRLASADGVCTVGDLTRDKEASCKEACEMDGGEYTHLMSVNPVRFTKMCELYTVNNVECNLKCVNTDKKEYFSKGLC